MFLGKHSVLGSTTPSVLFRYRNSLCKTGAHFVGRPVKREITETYTEDKYEARLDNIKVRECHVFKSLLLQCEVTPADLWHLIYSCTNICSKLQMKDCFANALAKQAAF